MSNENVFTVYFQYVKIESKLKNIYGLYIQEFSGKGKRLIQRNTIVSLTESSKSPT